MKPWNFKELENCRLTNQIYIFESFGKKKRNESLKDNQDKVILHPPSDSYNLNYCIQCRNG